jgi:hypothetical protein
MTLTDSVGGIAQRAVALARLELKLAALELRLKLRRFVRATVLGAIAALAGFFALAAVIGAMVAALAGPLPLWAAFLVTFAFLAGLATLAGLAALGDFRRAFPPVPETAIEEARRTVDTVRGRSNGR